MSKHLEKYSEAVINTNDKQLIQTKTHNAGIKKQSSSNKSIATLSNSNITTANSVNTNKTNQRRKKKVKPVKGFIYNIIKFFDNKSGNPSKIYKKQIAQKAMSKPKKLPAVIRLKNNFRKNGLNIIESYYNAYFIYYLRKSEKKALELKKVKKTYQKNIYDIYIAILIFIAKIFGALCLVSVKTKKTVLSLKVLSASVSIATIVFVTAMILHISSFEPNFQIYIDGQSVGIVENIKNLDDSIALVEKNISSVIDKSYKLSVDISYKIVLAKNPVYLSDLDLYNALYNLSQDSIIPAYGLYMDGKLVGASLREEDIDNVLQEILYEQYQSQILKNTAATAVETESIENAENIKNIESIQIIETVEGVENIESEEMYSESELEYFEFLNEVKVTQSKYLKNIVMTSNELKRALVLAASSRSEDALVDNALAEARLTNTIPRGYINALATTGLFTPISGNIGVGGSYYFVVDEFSADTGIADISVQFKKIKSETGIVEVPFSIEYKESDSYYTNAQIIESEGINGEDRVTARVTYFEGIEIGRDITHRSVIKEPVNQVVIIGTKPLPAAIPTGNLVFPVKYRYTTDEFGSDGGHRGIDFVAAHGTPITAADGGNVLFAGESESYGKHVILQHSKGINTVYAHMSELLVATGEKVFQGQEIGKVGSTGNSTGPHLHFEVHFDNVPIDPYIYLIK